mgnify:CR=1 FL=1
MTQNGNLSTDIEICGKLEDIEDINIKGMENAKRAIFFIKKGVMRRVDRDVGGFYIPVIVQDITLLKEQKSLNSDNPLNEKAIGTASSLKVGERYKIFINLTKLTVSLKDNTYRKITFLDAQEIYLVDKDYPGENKATGKFRLWEDPSTERNKVGLFSTLKLIGENRSRPRLVAISKDKNANYCTQLKKGDIIDIEGSIYADTYDIIDSGGNVNKTDSFSIYVDKIEK